MPAFTSSRLIMLMILYLTSACGSRSGKSFVPSIEGYPEKGKTVFVLHKDLLEVSGIDHLEGDKIAAVNDEKGAVFVVDLQTDSINELKFGDNDDYEEIVKVDSSYFILISNGDLIEFYPDSAERRSYKFRHKGKIEFESMFFHPKAGKLVLISKEQRKKRTAITAFSFDLKTRRFDTTPFFNITYKEVFVKLENYNADCKPSAAALNPINNKLYILASVGMLLLECTPEGRLLKIYKINPTHFPQPEGISFADNGDMYISNEGLEGKATILKFPYVAPE